MLKCLAVVLGAIVLTGCKGEKGDPGAAGTPGASATSFIVTRSGAITSNDMFVSVAGLNIQRGDILSVYHCLNTTCLQAPIFEPGPGTNVFYSVSGSTVELINMLAGGSNLYYITALEKL